MTSQLPAEPTGSSDLSSDPVPEIDILLPEPREAYSAAGEKLQELGLLWEPASSENSNGTGVSCLDKGDTTFARQLH